jgi:hypothetical protein
LKWDIFMFAVPTGLNPTLISSPTPMGLEPAYVNQLMPHPTHPPWWLGGGKLSLKCQYPCTKQSSVSNQELTIWSVIILPLLFHHCITITVDVIEEVDTNQHICAFFLVHNILLSLLLFAVFCNCCFHWSRYDWWTGRGSDPWKLMPCLLPYKEELWKCCSAYLQCFTKVRFIALNRTSPTSFIMNHPQSYYRACLLKHNF